MLYNSLNSFPEATTVGGLKSSHRIASILAVEFGFPMLYCCIRRTASNPSFTQVGLVSVPVAGDIGNLSITVTSIAATTQLY